MNKNHLLAFVLLLLAPLSLRAGAPLICHPYDIGKARTLPGGDNKGTSIAYDRSNLVKDTLALLTPETPVLVRMETLRRAAIYTTADLRGWSKSSSYTAEDRALARDLLQQLRERAAQATEDERAMVLFDVAFFSETMRQTNLEPVLDGYALLLRVAELRPNDPDIQFALALAAAYPKREPQLQQHLAQARALAQPGTLIAANLQSHFQ